MEHVRRLEGATNRSRGDYVLAELGAMGLAPLVQERSWPAIRNIIVDLTNQGDAHKRLFCAHYDATSGSPGANDNASSVAVLLELCRRLKDTGKPVRAVFFDREEGASNKPVLRMGLLGSLYYVWKNSLKDLATVFNLEFCGQGDTLAIWPAEGRPDNVAEAAGQKAAVKLAVPWQGISIPWALQTSDHLPFRIVGFGNAISLSMLTGEQIAQLRESLAGVTTARLLSGRRPRLPEPYSLFHTAGDTSDRLSEDSLTTMLAVVADLAGGS